MGIKWSFEENKICVEAFFKYIDFNIPLESVKEDVLNYVKENVKDFHIRSETSWVFKIDNIHYRFRKEVGLPPKGFSGKTETQLSIQEKYFQESKFFGAPLEKFYPYWFIPKQKMKFQLIPYNEETQSNIVEVKKLVRNKELVKNYLNNNRYCEYCLIFETFESISDDKMYFEVHHFIPYNQKVQKNYKYNLDNECNLVSLCPSCHRKIHLSKNRNEIIKFLFEKKNKSQDFITFYGNKGIEQIIKDYAITYGLAEKENELNKIDNSDLFDFI